MSAEKILTRNFVLSFFAQFTFSSVFFILIPTIPIYLSRLGSTDAEIGVLVGVLSVSSLILRPFVGRALLRIPERKFMMAGTILFIFSSVAYLLAPPFWPLLIVRVFQGIGLALFATASFTLVSRISPEARRGQSLGIFYLAINLAFALAPAFGMIVINSFNFTTLFLLCAGLSLCALLIILKLGRIQGDPLENSSPRDRSFLSREAFPPAIICFMASIIWGALTAFFPLFALSHGISNPGLFFGVFAIILILGRSLGGRILDTYNREKVIFPCLVVQIIAMTTLVFSTTFPMLILVAVIWGTGSAFLFPSLVAHALDRTGDARGPAIATYMALADLGAGMGSVIMGIILQLTSYTTMFFCLVVTGVINLLYFYFFVRKRGRDRYANL